MNKISGYTVTRNCLDLDYCFEECIFSLIGICDEVVVCDSDSTDGTRQRLDGLAEKFPHIRVINYPWPNPVNDIKWFTTWLNFTREQLTHPVQLQLDADEVLCPESYPEIMRAADAGHCRWFHRLNFWLDTKHIAPHGRVCGEQVVRMGPRQLWMPSDEPHPEGEPEIRVRAGWPPNAEASLRIFHFGFIRRPDALFKKVRAVNGAFFGTYDERLERAEKTGERWTDLCPFDLPLIPYSGNYPVVAHKWLTDRGYSL